MPYLQVRGIEELGKIHDSFGRMKKKFKFINEEIMNHASEEAVKSAKARATGKGGNLRSSIKAYPFLRKDGWTLRITAGKGTGRFRPKGNQDPGAYYAYYQEYGFKEHVIFRPWLWSRSPVVANEVLNEITPGEGTCIKVREMKGKKYMAAGYKRAARTIKNDIKGFILEPML